MSTFHDLGHGKGRALLPAAQPAIRQRHPATGHAAWTAQVRLSTALPGQGESELCAVEVVVHSSLLLLSSIQNPLINSLD